MCFDIGHVDLMPGEDACEFVHTFEFIISNQFEIDKFIVFEIFSTVSGELEHGG